MDMSYLTSGVLMNQALGGVQSNSAAGGISGSDAACVSFIDELQSEGEKKVDAYKKYLELRFGPVTVQSIGKDQKSLEAAGARMNGNDVVIAPNILNEMANNSTKAAYYEQKIQDFFDDIPKQQALCAAKGLVYEPCGVVIHEDGSVTYICGCSDSPERQAQVAAENKAKREKQAERQRFYAQLGMESADQQLDSMRYLMSQQLMSQSLFGFDGAMTGWQLAGVARDEKTQEVSDDVIRGILFQSALSQTRILMGMLRP